ncbi:MAG TPA: DUF4388 domain-containing protein [Bdellovibrionota bacterium]|nr:DUF4388 domain-containing protein [Bdellovibrionota bacterium]
MIRFRAQITNMSTQAQSVGSLQETPLVKLLQWIADNAFSGVLVLARDEVKKSFIFEQGKPVAARSNIMQETLGQILVREGRLTEAQLTKSLAMIKGREAVHQGEAFLQMGLIDRALLNESLHQQLLLRIHEVFLWADGRYGLIPSIPEDTAKIAVEENLLEISFRGLIRKYKGSKEPAAVDPNAKPMVVGGHNIDVAKLRLVGREMGFLRAITGVAAFKDILAKSRIEEPVAKAMLLAFRDLGMVRLSDQDSRDYDSTQRRFTVRTAEAPKASQPASASAAAKASNELAAEIAKRLEASAKQTYFELFGQGQKATTAEIKKAYFDLAKIFHPDRLPASTTKEDKKLAESLFAKLSEAHNVLSNDNSRKEYEATLQLQASGVDAQKANDIIQSEIEFQKGQILIKKGDFPAAIASLREAVKLYEKEPEYLVYLGWALYRQASKSRNAKEVQEGRALLEKGLKMNGQLVQGYFFLGMMAKSEGDLGRAKQLYQKVVDLQPKHQEANSELRLMNMRDTKQQSGGLKGIFRKRE